MDLHVGSRNHGDVGKGEDESMSFRERVTDGDGNGHKWPENVQPFRNSVGAHPRAC